MSLRVLYSYPHKLGANRICYIAWQQVNEVAAAGADVLAFPGVLHRPVRENVRIHPTLSRGRFRISYKLVGTMRALALHDRIVSRRIRNLAGQIDIVHTWPGASLHTLKTAASLGITTVLERPNAYTGYGYKSVQAEAQRLGLTLPPEDEYAYKPNVLRREEEEFRLADYLLCPSDFTIQSFLDQGFPREKLLKHQYGFDEKRFFPNPKPKDSSRGLTVFFCGEAAVRKGVHFALEAWLQSPACHDGTFLIAGRFLEAYAEKLSPMLSHPSVQVLGHRDDVPELMRKSDILLLPSIEEGFGLVCAEAIGSGCVPLVSTACTDFCRHMENALVHRIGDVQALAGHISMLHQDRGLLGTLRSGCLKTAPQITWTVAGLRLLQVYREALAAKQQGRCDVLAAAKSGAEMRRKAIVA